MPLDQIKTRFQTPFHSGPLKLSIRKIRGFLRRQSDSLFPCRGGEPLKKRNHATAKKINGIAHATKNNLVHHRGSASFF